MKLDDLCMGCMSIKGTEPICPACGWQDGTQESGFFLAPGTVLIQRYLVGRVLGNGGFGVTYLGMDLNLNIKLAIKEYFPQGFVTRNSTTQKISVYSGDNEAAYRDGLNKFLEEAKVLAKFSMIPGIVTVRDYFSENNTAYLVMYYLEGMTLKEFLIRNQEVIPFDTALTILSPAIKALSEVHKHQILHRDISPDNIYITKDRQIKLLDFGAARQVLGEQSKSLDVILKRGYAPEEQYRSRGKQGPWTDVYAVAATFYRAIVGETPPDSLERLGEDTLIPPSRRGVKIPSNIENALMKALALRAANRYQSMDEFHNALIPAVRENNPSKPVNTTPSGTTGCLTLGAGVFGLFVGALFILKHVI